VKKFGENDMNPGMITKLRKWWNNKKAVSITFLIAKRLKKY